MIAPPILLVSGCAWQATAKLFSEYAARRVEGGCFWYGHRDEEKAIAVLLGVPRQINRPRNFEIGADDLARLTEAVSKLGLVAVAQIHSHPGLNVAHSPWDDSLVVSKRVYSLVLPNYGKNPISLVSVGVHRFEEERWLRLNKDAAKTAIQLLPDKLDLR